MSNGEAIRPTPGDFYAPIPPRPLRWRNDSVWVARTRRMAFVHWHQAMYFSVPETSSITISLTTKPGIEILNVLAPPSV